MRVTISREAKTSGFFSKTHYVQVLLEVQFSDEERQLIKQNNLEDLIVCDKPQSKIVVKRLGNLADLPGMFQLPLSILFKGPMVYDVDDQVQAQRYEEDIKKGLAGLKKYLDRANVPGGTTSYEL